MHEIRVKAEEMIAAELAQKVVAMIVGERIGVNDDFEPAMMEFFIDKLKISLEE